MSVPDSKPAVLTDPGRWVLYPIALVDARGGPDAEVEQRRIAELESLVCSIAAAVSTATIEELVDYRRSAIEARAARIDKASRWQEPKRRRGRMGRVRNALKLLGGAELACVVADQTGSTAPLERARDLVERSLQATSGIAELQGRGLLMRAQVEVIDAEAAPNLMSSELSNVAARRAARYAAEHKLRGEILTTAAITAAQASVIRAERSLSKRACDLAANALDLSGDCIRETDSEEEPFAFRLGLLDSRLEEARARSAAFPNPLNHLDAGIDASRRLFLDARDAQSAERLALSTSLLARQMLDRSTVAALDPGQLVEILLTGICSATPLSLTLLDLLCSWARLIYALGTEAAEESIRLFAAVVWSTSCDHLCERDPARAYRAAEAWATAISRVDGPEGALSAHEFARAALRRLVETHPFYAHKLIWLADGNRVHTAAAAATAAVGDVIASAEIAESGRSALVQPMIAPPTKELQALDREGAGVLVARYEAARRAELRASQAASVIQGPETDLSEDDFEVIMRNLKDVAAEMASVRRAIRARPGFERFPRPPQYSEIRAAANDAPLAYIVPGDPEGSLILVCREAPEPVRIPLPHLTRAAEARFVEYQDAYRKWDPAVHGLNGWPELLDESGEWLWDAVMGPLLGALGDADFVRLVPMATTMFLPLHLAWTQNGSTRTYALDRVAISYAPSASLLRYAQKRPSRPKWSPLLVDDPRLNLEDSSSELDAALRRFGEDATYLPGPAASLTVVKEELARHNMAHISAHGFVNEELPLYSGIDLAEDGVLTVGDVWREPFPQLELLVLSSCDSAMAGGKTLDESLSFPGMMFGTSSTAVIAAQWRVDQAATSRVFDGFYRDWDASKEPKALATALRDAQLALRDGALPHPVWWGGFVLYA